MYRYTVCLYLNLTCVFSEIGMHDGAFGGYAAGGVVLQHIL